MRSEGLVVIGALLLGCGGPQRARSYEWAGLDEASGQNLRLQQGPMPANQTFTGVYRSPQIGDIELVQTGDAVVGRYEYDRGSCHVVARIEGNATGNLLRFTWREDHRPCGRIAPVVGRAFFLYHVEETGDIQRGRLFGRWGYGEDDQEGGSWTAFKIAGRQPSMLENQSGSSGGEAGGAGGSS
jgi:hypothetical protein